MQFTTKIIRAAGIVAGTVLLILFGGVAVFWVVKDRMGAAERNLHPIVDFNPSNFIEVAEAPFFYRIDNKLKYAASIASDAPTLFESPHLYRWDFYPSPDNKKLLAVDRKNLYLIQKGKETITLIENARFYDIPLGEFFYDSRNLQWDAGSRYVFIPYDKKTEPRNRSKNAVLFRIDTENISAPEIIAKNFKADDNYFSVTDKAVCFGYLADKNKKKWRCTTKNSVSDIEKYSRTGILLENSERITGIPFAYHSGGGETWSQRTGFFIKHRFRENFDGMFSKNDPNKPLIQFRRFKKFPPLDKEFSGFLSFLAVLPGGRYVVFSIDHGEDILLDRSSLAYRALPRNVEVMDNPAISSDPAFRPWPDLFYWGKSLHRDSPAP
ncbi:MAG: hypothetical protein LBL72_07700 [Candidatus Accumulibacter sp.]|jgi:hypothetical protein|nr:hypothetical protein [Accumulibacter sp.]